MERSLARESEAEPAPLAVTEHLIRHWCEAVEDGNPLYLDEAYARSRGLFADDNLVIKLLHKYQTEGRVPKACDPRDLIDRAIDRCRLQRQPVKLTEQGLEIVWNGYFGKPGTDPKRR